MVLRLQLLPTSYFFALDNNSALTIDINSSIFNNQADFIGSISYTGTMPLEPNRKAIRNAQYMATDAALRTLDVMMWLNELPYKQVKMNFTIQDNKINYNLYIDTGIIAKQLKKVQLNDLYVPGTSSQVALGSAAGLRAYMLAACTAAPGAYPMVFYPFKNDAAYQADVYTPYYYYADPKLGGFPYPPGVKFRFSGLGPSNHIYNTLVASAYGVTPDTNPANFSDITLSADILQPVNKVINAWELDADGNGAFAVDNNFPIQNTQSPAFLVTYVLRRIAAYFGYTVDGLVMNEEWANRLTIVSNIAIDTTFIIADMPFFMPGILVSDFLKHIRTEYGWLIDFDQTRKVMIIESLANLVSKAEKVDLRAAQVVAGYQETGTTSQAYVISQAPDSNDQTFSAVDPATLPVLQIGDPLTAVEETDISLNSVPTTMITEVMPSQPAIVTPIISNYKIPYIKKPIYGSSPLNQFGSVLYKDRLNFSLRFLIYWGMQNDDGGYQYPFASSDNTDVTGNVLGSLTLQLNPAGAAYSAVKSYYDFLSVSKPFQMIFELTAALFAKIKANTTLIIKDPVLQNDQVCIMSQVSADFESGKEKITTTATLYPIVQPNNAVPVVTQAVAPPPPPPFDNGLVYARMVLANQTITHPVHPTPSNNAYSDVIVNFFSDAAGTIPKVVTDLYVGFSTANTDSSTGITTTTYTHEYCNGNSQTLEVQAPTSEALTDGSGKTYTWVYALAASSKYTIIS